MARFNPPPGWPTVPDGWVPPAGWQPDPRWPRPPEGWQWWLPDAPGDRAHRHTAVATTPPGNASHGYPAQTMGFAAGYPQQVPGVRPASTSTPVTVTGFLLAAAGVIIVIGSLMPWVDLGIISVSGGDGVITLVLGVLVLAGGLVVGLAHRRWAAVTALILALASAAVAVADIVNIASAQIFGSALGLAVVGMGLWAVLVGAILGIGTAIAAIAFSGPR